MSRTGLSGKTVVLGVSGSIAAYKAAELASKMVQQGATVHVAMTPAASRFIAPLTFQSLTHKPAITNLFDPTSDIAVDHVALAQQADVFVVAPATANIVAALAHGLAGDPVTTIALSVDAPVVICPAMEHNMYDHPATQANLAVLKERGAVVVEPASGRLASGLTGKGRLADLDVILGTIRHVLGRGGDLAGRRIVVTAGGTREAIDPVRFITNRSSGKMGHAVAEAARDRGACVTLVTTAPVPAHLSPGVDIRSVASALEMQAAVEDAVRDADALIMAAAVADYRPAAAAQHKLKKRDDESGFRTLELVRNPDILASVTGPAVKVGFAAETQDLVANARKKLAAKRLAMIVANDVTAPDGGFDADTNRVTIIHASGQIEELPTMPKIDVANHLLDRVKRLLG